MKTYKLLLAAVCILVWPTDEIKAQWVHPGEPSDLPAFGVSPRGTGDERTDSVTATAHRWHLTASVGTTSSGPASDIERAMVASGFNQTYHGFLGPLTYPFSHTGIGEIGTPWMIAIRYSINPRVSVGFVLSDAPIGRTSGYGNGRHLTVQYSVFVFSPIVGLQYEDIVRFGLGPAVFKTRCREEYAGREDSATKIGALLDLGISRPLFSSPFCVDLGVQYRYLGETHIGPYQSTDLGTFTAIFPVSSVTYNHIFVAVGLGVRL
jgi:hypothetical protein